jgi:HSP20 family protein
MSKHRTKQLPVRIYQSENQFALAAPVAGLEPGDITITIEGRRVTIQGKQRGPHQHDLDLLKAEWSIGPYHRDILLPENVDGSLANATYGNGVLVLTMPKAKAAENSVRAEFTLEPIKATRGERVGHMGHDIQATTTKQHFERLAQIPKRVAI